MARQVGQGNHSDEMHYRTTGSWIAGASPFPEAAGGEASLAAGRSFLKLKARIPSDDLRRTLEEFREACTAATLTPAGDGANDAAMRAEATERMTLMASRLESAQDAIGARVRELYATWRIRRCNGVVAARRLRLSAAFTLLSALTLRAPCSLAWVWLLVRLQWGHRQCASHCRTSASQPRKRTQEPDFESRQDDKGRGAYDASHRMGLFDLLQHWLWLGRRHPVPDQAARCILLADASACTHNAGGSTASPRPPEVRQSAAKVA